jgi:hypothetical protein
MLKDQHESINRLTSMFASAAANPTPPPPTRRHAKIALPEKFSGRRDKLHEFLAKYQQ